MMSDFRFRNLDQYKIAQQGDEITLAIPLFKTPLGKSTRFCPNEECRPRLFQLGEAPAEQAVAPEADRLTRRKPKTPGITCPYCGTDQTDDEFTYAEDVEAAKELTLWAALNDVRGALGDMVKDFNQNVTASRNPLFSIEMKLEGCASPQPYVWREDLLRELQCDICARPYGVYAIGLFCPDCGARNVHVHFRREVELVMSQVAMARRAEQDGKKELSFRLLGNAHEDVLTALETFLKTIFRFLVKTRLPDQAEVLSEKKAIGNRFQNIERARELFGKIAIDPFAGLTEDQLQCLHLNIEKRHVLGHNLSLADESFSQKIGAETGQTIALVADDVQKFSQIASAIIRRLEEGCPEFQPPRTRPMDNQVGHDGA